MSIWGKVIGGVAGFALGGPLGAIIGASAGHAVDRSRAGRRGSGSTGSTGFGARDSVEARQTAFAVAVIVLSAKMAKADGQVTRDEIDAFKQVFQIPPGDMGEVGRLFNEARQDAEGFEPYARQIGEMFAHDPAVLEGMVGGLFYIAKADGVVHPDELRFLEQVAREFGFDAAAFQRIKENLMGKADADAYGVLGLSRDADDGEIKSTYRKLIREHHPDTLIAKGLPQEFIDVATAKMAAINAAYDRIESERGLK